MGTLACGRCGRKSNIWHIVGEPRISTHTSEKAAPTPHFHHDIPKHLAFWLSNLTVQKPTDNTPLMNRDLNTSFAALADPTRRAVIERLVTGPATVSDLARPHSMALPTLMRHLKTLEDCGLVRSVKRGRVRTCHIEAAPLMELQGWLEWQRRVWETRLDKLNDLAESIDPNANTERGIQ